MNSNIALVTYDIREDDEGWTVYNMLTGETARVNGVPQTGLDIEVADDLTDLLDALERQKAKEPVN